MEIPDFSIMGGFPLTTSSEPLPCRLPRHGERLPDCCPAHLALAEDVDDFKLLMILTLLALPLCVFFRKPPPGPGSQPSVPAH